MEKRLPWLRVLEVLGHDVLASLLCACGRDSTSLSRLIFYTEALFNYFERTYLINKGRFCVCGNIFFLWRASILLLSCTTASHMKSECTREPVTLEISVVTMMMELCDHLCTIPVARTVLIQDFNSDRFPSSPSLFTYMFFFHSCSVKVALFWIFCPLKGW